MKKYYRGNGYMAYYMPHHHRAGKTGLVYEHIIVAERKLGRELRIEEVVHHEDENKKNNSEENLYIFATREDHNRFHTTGNRIQVDDYWISPKEYKASICKYCGKEFNYESSLSNGIYCSIECSNVGSRTVGRPTKEELFEMIKTKSFLQIGREYGVSDNAIRKWCKFYLLPYRKKDLKIL